MTLDEKSYPHPKTNQTNAECQGYYQNIAPHSTNRASGSLVAAPNQTSNHHYYHEGFKQSTKPLFTSIRHCLCDEEKQATTYLVQPFIHTGMNLRGITSLFTVKDGGYTNLINSD